jgi:hypothetical protein
MSSTFTIQFQSPKKNRVRNVREDYTTFQQLVFCLLQENIHKNHISNSNYQSILKILEKFVIFVHVKFYGI